MPAVLVSTFLGHYLIPESECLFETRSLKFPLYILFPMTFNRASQERIEHPCFSASPFQSTQGTEEHMSKTGC